MQPPLIALTMGDPAGVGPEICLRALAETSLATECRLAVFGDAAVLRRCGEQIGLPLSAEVLAEADWPARHAEITRPVVLDLRSIDSGSLVPGTVNAETGAASYAYIEAALDAALAGQIDAVATGPISKEALHAAGIEFPGHTEIFATRCAAPRWCMMQYSEEITTAGRQIGRAHV